MSSITPYIYIYSPKHFAKFSNALQHNTLLTFAVSSQIFCFNCSKSMSTSVCECEWGMRDWGKLERIPKSGLFGIRLVKRTSSNANVFCFEVPVLKDSVWLFTERFLRKQMLFAAPRLPIQINISLISACLTRHLCTDVDVRLNECGLFL